MNTSAIQPPKKIIKNIVRVGVILLMVYISLLAIGMGRDVIQCEGEGISNRILAIFRTASIQKEGLGLGTIVQSLLMFVLYKLYSRMLKFSQFKIIYVINALFFSLFIIIGVLFEVTGSLNLMGSKIQVAKVMILFLGSFLILYAIISTVCQEIEMSGISNKKIGLEIPYNIKRHPLLFIFGIIFLMRLPYIILSYPGRFMWDTGVQISQWFNVNPENSVYRYGEYVRLTNHHPMFHTAIMGSCIWLGKMILNSVNAGYFFFICIQYITNAAVCALTVYTILKCAVKRQSRNKIVLSMGGGVFASNTHLL